MWRRCSVAGHNQGRRVAYRLALEQPTRIQRTAVLDIIPTNTAREIADARFALGYWPWSLLAQPEPLPERLIAAARAAIVDAALSGWGSPREALDPEIRAECIEALLGGGVRT